jgi:hypothetical protein
MPAPSHTTQLTEEQVLSYHQLCGWLGQPLQWFACENGCCMLLQAAEQDEAAWRIGSDGLIELIGLDGEVIETY